MSMKVFGHPRSSRPPFYGVIPKSQLEALCRVLNLGSQAAQYPWPWKEMELGILVDSPFGPDFREMINDTLMPIVHRHLQDKTFTAHHRQKPGEFVQDLTHKDAPFRELTSVDGLIDRMNARKELGSKSFKRQDFVGAATVWTYAIYYVAYYCDETKINRRIAADLKTYNLRLGELGFLLGSNAAAAWNALGKRPFGERPFGKPREYYSSMSRWSLERSMKLRKTYVASKDQKLKYEYRLAIACKHLEDWGALWARLTMLWAWAGGRTGSLWPNMVRSIVGWQKWRRSRFLRTVVSISGINDGAVGVGDQAVSTPLTLYWNDSDKLECHQHER